MLIKSVMKDKLLMMKPLSSELSEIFGKSGEPVLPDLIFFKILDVM